jgi:diguanylate cyclase (GGDEF)-like protein
MEVAPMHPQEAARLAQLRALGLLDTEPDEAFDRITRLARTLCSTPIALVSLVDEDRQWFKSRQGLDAPATGRDEAFCAHAILDDAPMVVEDATADARFSDNPLVTGEPHIGFYAGIPLHAPNGLPMGTLCVLDNRARTMSAEELTGLQDLAAVVEDLFGLRRLATIDPLTGLQNRRGFLASASAILAVADREGRGVTVGYLDINGLKRVNDELGHDSGDDLLRGLARILSDIFRDADAIGRLGGDEFAVLLFGAADDKASAPIDRLAAAVEQFNRSGAGTTGLSVSTGWASRGPGGPPVVDLLAAADAAMYEDKRGWSG